MTMSLLVKYGNKDKMHYTCSNCKEEAHVSLNEFRRGRRCKHCAKSRAKQRNQKRYGVENVSQSEEIKQRIKNSNMEKYGVDHHMKVPEILQKAIDTNIDKYGLAFAFHSEESFDKIHATCMERYGVEYPLQSEEMFYKKMETSTSRKEYVFPSGRTELCEGYEPRCLDHLLEIYDEDDIEVGYKDREAIWYPNPDNDGKLSRYFPDGFIKSENAIVEVKSDYYYEKNLAKNHAKFKAVIGMGMQVFLYVFNEKDLLYTKILTKDGISVLQNPSAEIVWPEDD